MHLFNGWLPPPVAEETKKEKESFARVVRCVKELHRPDDPESVYATLKWISVVELYVRAKSDLSVEDVTELVEIGLQIFHSSQDKLYAQVRWGNVLVRLMNKYRKKLSLKVEWRPLYDTLIHAHFSRSPGPEGWRLRQRHFEAVTSLTRSCRRFFPQGAASDIWSEFMSLLENPWHNSSFEGSGFVRLFLPTNPENQDFFSEKWINNCLELWDSIPNCQFWNSQWAAVLARVIKNCSSIDWESYLPMLFSRFLNMFEVPVANGSGSYPFSVDVPRNTRFLFPNRTMTPSKSIAQSIVYFLKPGSSAHEQFKKLVNLLEQFVFLDSDPCCLFFPLTARLLLRSYYYRNPDSLSKVCLGKPERIAFVEVVLKLIDRGQYSKNEHLSETVAAATSILSYVEPSLVLPFVASRFHLALETTTATHQLKTAMMSVAFAGRSILQSYMSTAKQELGGDMDDRMFLDLIGISLSNALLGMDANDPPKTLATMQLIGSIFSNMAVLDDSSDDISIMTMASFSEWLDEFLCRLIALLQHLEPNSVINEGLSSSATSGTFLVEDGPYYYCMLEILLGRLSGSLYSQALKKISKFVRTNILPGAIAEVGLLCCACVHSNPEEAVVQIVEPMILAVISSLKDTPVTGFGGKGSADTLGSNKKDKQTLSPALEAAIDYQLKVLSVAITYGGSSLLRYKDHFIEAISSAFNSSSWKVNGAGDHLLRSLLGSLILYYPMDQYKCLSRHPAAPALEEWISTKASSKDEQVVHSRWHVPTKEEIQFANELIDLYLQSALDDLLRICQSNIHSDAGDEKTHLKVTLLRIDSTLQGVLSCLPDFRPSPKHEMVEELPFFIAGASGSSVGSAEIRERTAETIHAACKYLLEKKSDDSILLVLIIRIMDALGNYGSLEYDEWYNHRQAWKLESAAIVEPPANFITEFHSKGKRSSHHESMKSQKAIIELFVKYNIHFAGLSRNILRSLDSHVEGSTSGDLVSQISSMSFDSSSLHWRYNLMANRVLLLLAMSCRMDPAFSFKILNETAGHFLKNLKSQLPQTRILAISALNTLLKESPHKMQGKDQPPVSSQENANSSLDLALSQIFQEEGFFKETFESLSHIHITDTDSSSRGNHGSSSFQSMADKSITRFYFEFSASWPRTPSWISLLGSDIFYPSFARIFKRLAQECGVPVLLALKSPLEEFCNAKERPKQCVAAETLAGLLHSDVNGLQSEWDSWIMVQLQNVILGQSVESIPEWATCIRYAVTGKGKQGTKIPMMRQQILDCIVAPLPPTATTTVVSKRYAFLSAALIELSPPKMPVSEVKLHIALLDELIRNMSHSSAQIREAIGVILSVLCSNIRLRMSYQQKHPSEEGRTDVDSQLKEENWFKLISARASEAVTNIQQASISDSMDTSADVDMENGDYLDDVKWVETKVIEVILASADDSNWRIRSSTLTYLRTFMYRHTFILAHEEKQKIWKTVEKLLVDSQVREHAAAVLAGLMKGGDEDFAADFRDRSYAEANSIQKKRNRRKSSSTQSIATVHGAVLGLVASVLSVPYDMPSWLPDHVTLLARFAGEPTPVKSTVTKAVAEFRRTHADTWNIQKDSFTEEQLEVLADTSSSSSYFA
ncbi:hypothetical protein F2Q69_00003350 [Brassica cretica]|uniref:Proteasome activator complex subunit 4 C-terminal domain-containing protein n=1 Tax=Brassica cretica TaxID=69181 RepID=A0A8S9P273_BRACR|nr:hypothetical protein F2Q69_00003350 [Brassica cretica]